MLLFQLLPELSESLLPHGCLLRDTAGSGPESGAKATMRPKGNQSRDGLSALDGEQRRIAPQSFERIEVSGGAHEDVHDHVDVVEEAPAALRAAFLVARTRA